MSLIPFEQFSVDVLKQVRLIATDMDGTLTQQGRFTPALLQSLETMQRLGIPVLIVTGRSAGWVNGVVSYLPVVGAIAENGGLIYINGETGKFLVEINDIKIHRQKLAEMFALLQAEFPQIVEAEDNLFRLTDWTFDVAGLSEADLTKMSDRCHSHGWGFTYSTVQCHIKPLDQEKATALLTVLPRFFPAVSPQQVITIGDSPNDESLFRGDRFPHSVGVANVLHYVDQLEHQPAYVTVGAEVVGFAEVVAAISAAQPDKADRATSQSS